MIVLIDQIASVAVDYLNELNVHEYQVEKKVGYTNIIINKAKCKWIVIYDDTICIAYGKNLFGNIKSDIIFWLKNEKEIVFVIKSLIGKRFGKNNYINDDSKISRKFSWKNFIFNKRYLELNWGWGKGADWHYSYRILVILFNNPICYIELIKGPKIVYSANHKSVATKNLFSIIQVTSLIEKTLIELNIMRFATYHCDDNYSYVVIDESRKDKYINIDHEEIEITYNKSKYLPIYSRQTIYLPNIANETELTAKLRDIISLKFADYIMENSSCQNH
jgi:hypothetical protein